MVGKILAQVVLTVKLGMNWWLRDLVTAIYKSGSPTQLLTEECRINLPNQGRWQIFWAAFEIENNLTCPNFTLVLVPNKGKNVKKMCLTSKEELVLLDWLSVGT